MVGLQQLQVYPGFPVKAMQKSLRHQVAEVFIARSVLAEQNQMVGVVVQTVDTIRHFPARHIDLAADNRLDTRCLGRFIEIDTAVHDAVIRQGNGRLTKLLDPVHHAVNAAGAVQKAVLAMDMQMCKTHCAASFAMATMRCRRWFMAGLVIGGSIIAASSERDASGFSSRALAA